MNMPHHTESELRVGDLMTQPVHTLTATQSLPLAEWMMRLHHVRHIPVIDDASRLVGLVTHRDLLAAKISSLAPLSDDERSSLQLAIPVSRVMRKQVWTIGPDAFAIAAARIMREQEIGCLPVVEGGKLVGIVTEGDLLALVTDSLALERRAPPHTMERVMTRVPITIHPDTTIAEARATMARYRIRHLPVIENGEPVSVVCDRDLSVAEAIFKETTRTPAAHVVGLLGRSRFQRVAPETAVDAVLVAMYRDRLEAVLVVSDRELVGIFTPLDACRLRAEESRPPPSRDRIELRHPMPLRPNVVQ